ncbi:Arylesterase precursor [Hartmannibacter diazotrophicus]|uniref:Arylesterase n=1 Tax=Hartmannibacter diazotrophicus TaxID=1482074 RepID=A0A2C9DD16_9HYPH|nr:arylesterase [Hartmannibacter diazotrophicus]SON58070.1 Arylesterase precursor [Hartmannibacter diazotrophicus]
MLKRLLLAFLLTCAVPGVALAETVRILALGDSLTAGLGLDPEDAFPAKLEVALNARGYNTSIFNAGVSGDTTSGGLARLEWSLGAGADAAIVELGANDAFRGVDPKLVQQNLDTIITTLQQKGVKVLLAGMLSPPNMGEAYASEFNAVFPELARKHGVLFFPFFLKDVAADPALNQGDGIHPTAAGVDVIVANILPLAETLVKEARTP